MNRRNFTKLKLLARQQPAINPELHQTLKARYSATMTWLKKGLIAGLLLLLAAVELSLFCRACRDQLHRLHLTLTHGLAFQDPVCTTPYCDYPMFWLAGHFARHGQAAMLYDHPLYAAAAATLLPYGAQAFFPFVYPPPVLLPALVISALPVVAGYYLFTALMLAACAFLLRRAGLPWWCIALGLLSPESLWCLYLGQWGCLCGALLLLGLTFLNRRPSLAGFLLALLCIKPQYALLVPIIVLARRAWRAAAAGAATLAALLALTLIIAGAPAFAAYLTAGRAAARVLLEAPFSLGYQATGISTFWMARSLHAAIPLAYAAQALVSLTAAALAYALWRRAEKITLRLLTLTICLTALATPYGFYDDLAVYAALLPAFLNRGLTWRNLALAALWVAPAYVFHIVELTGILTTPLILTAATLLVWQTPDSPAEHTA